MLPSRRNASDQTFRLRPTSDYGVLIGRDHQGAFDEAIKSMAENDSRDEIVTLYREAARTTTDEDRAIVVKIDQLTSGDRQSRWRGRSDAQQIREVAARRAELEERTPSSVAVITTTQERHSAMKRPSTTCSAAFSTAWCGRGPWSGFATGVSAATHAALGR